MKTLIRKLDNDWKYVKNISRTTDNKDFTNKEPTNTFKKKLLLSEHSPIREITIKWYWENIKSWIAVHFSRHKYECYVSTQRDDRTQVDRDKSPQDTPVNMDNSANAQHLIDLARKRLCRASHPETRAYMEDLKLSIHDSGETELADVLVPNCVYRCGCPEFNNCGYFIGLVNQKYAIVSSDIQLRYDTYNEIFYKNKKEK